MACYKVRPLSRIIAHFSEAETFFAKKNAWKSPVKEFGYSKVAGLYQFFPKISIGSKVFSKHLF